MSEKIPPRITRLILLLLINLSAVIKVADIVDASGPVEVMSLVLLWVMGLVVGVSVGFGGGMNATIRLLRNHKRSGQRE